MTKPNRTHITVILDRSGSMERIRGDTVGGLEAFFTEQKKEKTDDTTVTFVQFDDQYEVSYENRPLADVPPVELKPRGSTALLDAIGRTIKKMGQDFAALPEDERPDMVIVAIVTDGYENASREYQHSQVMELISHQRDVYKWTFVFLGANQDAIATGTSLGISASNAISYASNSRGVGSVYQSLSRNLKSARLSRNIGEVGFTASQRSSAMGEDEADDANADNGQS